MKNNYLLFYLALGGLAILLLILLLLSFFSSSRTTNPTTLIPTPFTQSTQKTFSDFEEHPTVVQDVRVIKVLPENNKSVSYFPVQEINITFTATMNPANVHVSVNPPAETTIRLNPTDDHTIIISPITVWTPGVTQLTILPTTTSLNLVPMKDAFIYEFSTKFPENPPGTNY